MFDRDDIYWLELRPKEGGRNVIVKRTPAGTCVDITLPAFNARTRVHEYGGGDYLVSDGIIYFSNFSDQRLYRQQDLAIAEPLTAPGDVRYADACMDHARQRLICVREDHSSADSEAVNSIVAVNLEPGGDYGVVLIEGNDFYSSPRVSPDGTQLAWLTWNHPNMPWDGTELWVGKITSDGRLEQSQCVAGGKEESIFQPEWSPESVLHFVSDRTGWWNLYRRDPAGEVRPICPREAEFGQAQWVFGQSTYAFLSADQLVCAYTEGGQDRLARLDIAAGRL